MTDTDLIIQDLRRDNKRLHSQIDDLYRQIYEYQKRLLAYEGIKAKGENNDQQGAYTSVTANAE